MQELLISEDQLIHRRNELENKQKYLCTLLHAAPVEFKESSYSLFVISLVYKYSFRSSNFPHKNQSNYSRSCQNA